MEYALQALFGHSFARHVFFQGFHHAFGGFCALRCLLDHFLRVRHVAGENVVQSDHGFQPVCGLGVFFLLVLEFRFLGQVAVTRNEFGHSVRPAVGFHHLPDALAHQVIIAFKVAHQAFGGSGVILPGGHAFHDGLRLFEKLAGFDVVLQRVLPAF